MTSDLDKILISYKQTDFDKRLRQLHSKRIPTRARFENYFSDENRALVDILRDVTENGDKAVAKYTKKFDKVELTPEEFCISEVELKKAHARIDKNLLASIRQAIANVRKYQEEIFVGNSKHRGIKYTPIRRVGICVPGASAPLPSTVIMTAVPAQVAGVEEIAVVSPPRHKGSIHPVTLAVCYELGIDEVYRIGGAQAVAALASKKGSIAKVDMIAGPGNKWVQGAKKNVAGEYVGIESIAGPSEVLIIADENANPAWVAADMLSQAEHAKDSTAVTITDSEISAENILKELKIQLKNLSRNENAKKSLIELGGIVLVANMAKAIDFSNEFAAEHLQIQCGEKSREVAEKIRNAGAIFIGDYSPVAVGDYWAGPSHTLPTGQTAKFSSALSSNDFIKSTSIIEYSDKQLAESADDIIRLAETEGLTAHAKSVRIRQQRQD
ncbi:MAG: histidinol dehydrogenase [Planctomycetota bacterium]|jgi:histidinol dehydrogenase